MGKTVQPFRHGSLGSSLAELRGQVNIKPSQRQALLNKVDNRFQDASFLKVIDPGTSDAAVGAVNRALEDMTYSEREKWGRALVENIPIRADVNALLVQSIAETVRKSTEKLHREDFKFEGVFKDPAAAALRVSEAMAKGSAPSGSDQRQILNYLPKGLVVSPRMIALLETQIMTLQRIIESDQPYVAVMMTASAQRTIAGKPGSEDRRSPGFIQKESYDDTVAGSMLDLVSGDQRDTISLRAKQVAGTRG